MPIPAFNPKRVKPESAVPRYRPDGNGRDLFIDRSGIDRIPSTGVTFVENKREPRAKQLTSGAVTGSIPALPRFIPNGTGRDLFQQCNPNPLVTHTGSIFSLNPPIQSSKGLGVTRVDRPPPKYIPNGSGRDLFFSEVPITTKASIRRANVQKAPRCRTQPPPRFSPTGSGRDTFQNFSYEDDASVFSMNSLRGGYSSPSRGGFAYGDESICMNSRRGPDAVLRRYHDRQGTSIKRSSQVKSMDRLSTSPTRAMTTSSSGRLMTRIDSPLAFSPVQTRAVSAFEANRRDV